MSWFLLSYVNVVLFFLSCSISHIPHVRTLFSIDVFFVFKFIKLSSFIYLARLLLYSLGRASLLRLY